MKIKRNLSWCMCTTGNFSRTSNFARQETAKFFATMEDPICGESGESDDASVDAGGEEDNCEDDEYHPLMNSVVSFN